MICFNSADLRKIIACYEDLGQKRVFKKSLAKLSINKRVFLYYSKKRNIPICALPRVGVILSSKQGFLCFCYNFFAFVNMYDCCIPISPPNIRSIAKFVVTHEVGHILDPNIYNSKEEYAFILGKLIDKLIEYNIDIKNTNLLKSNLPYEIEECILELKKNLIVRETNAWDIAKSISVFESKEEELIFNKIKEYALATYNYGNLTNIIKEHNIDTYFRYRKFF